MQIKVWGCRGSLPTPGPNTIKYGGNTTCLEVRLKDGTLIILDAGSGIKRLGQRLLKRPILTEIYLLLTHAHWDHLVGFPFFQPAYHSGYTIRVRGGPKAKRSLQRFLAQQMEAPFFPVPFSIMQAGFDFNVGRPPQHIFGAAEIVTIPLNHPNGGYGFKITEASKSFVFLPDNELDFAHEGGLTEADYIDFCQGASLLLHDAQYTDEEYETKKGWGHTRLASAVALSLKAKVDRFGLFHHDPDHTDADVDRMVATAQTQISHANRPIKCFGVAEGMEISV